MTDDFVKLIKTGGAPSLVELHLVPGWCGPRRWQAAMLYDADCNGYFQNPQGASQEAGNIAWARSVAEGKSTVKSNLWTWAIAMNSSSKNKDAAWLFMQYFTARNTPSGLPSMPKSSIRPASPSSNLLTSRLSSQRLKATLTLFKAQIDTTGIQFTPQPHFFETTTEWAATLQDIVGGKYKSTQEAMDKLKPRWMTSSATSKSSN
jgi:multiple sugar transport system substrate-binding protein